MTKSSSGDNVNVYGVNVPQYQLLSHETYGVNIYVCIYFH